MVYLGDLVRRVSARLWRTRSDDPLRRPLGRALDGAIDEALAARGMARADLFEPEQSVAPHRQRIAAMLAAQGLTPEQVTARHWSERAPIAPTRNAATGGCARAGTISRKCSAPTR
jgi:hypothetical protein